MDVLLVGAPILDKILFAKTQLPGVSEFTSLSGLSKFQLAAITVENTHYKAL